MRVMTYNVRIGIESSMAEVAAAIQAQGVPDVVALQEIGVRWRMGEKIDQPAYLADAVGLPHHAFVGALTDESGGRFGIALLSRYPFDRFDVTMLPREHDEQRVMMRARLLGEQPFWVLNTHLSVRPRERALQAALVGAAAALAEGPVLVLGDLNALPDSGPRRAVRGRLLDCFDARGEGPPETFSVKRPMERIDYVCCGEGLLPAGPCRVDRQALASDHFPLLAEVAFGDPPHA